MKKYYFVAALLFPTLFSGYVFGHCQVPCGVYTDELRFMQMLEDQTTIEKSCKFIIELSENNDGQSHNQLTRWVATKDSHATKIQKIIAEYFLTQRIKSSSKDYEKLLIGAHSIMVAAMKCKQSTKQTAANDLKLSILAFQKIYQSK